MSSVNADVERQETSSLNHSGNADCVYIIQGITNDGRKFRPSDWAERMSGALSSFGGGRIHYSTMLRPIAYNGVKAVVLDPKLEEREPELFAYIMDFARSNNLRITEAPRGD